MALNKFYKVILFFNKEIVYNENLPFAFTEPNENDIKSFIKLINPFIKFNKIEWHYLRQLTEKEL